MRYADALLPQEAERNYIVQQACGASQQVWSSGDLSRFIYGIQAWSGGAELELLRALPTIAGRFQGSMSSREIANAFFGLHRLRDGPELRTAVGILGQQLPAANFVLDIQQLGNVSLGLRHLEDCQEKRVVLASFAGLLERAPNLSPAGGAGSCCKILYSLCKSNDGPEVRSFLRALAPKLAAYPGGLQEQKAANALYGLFRQTDCEEVRQILHALAQKLEISHFSFKAQGVGNSLYGLRGCGGSREAYGLVEALLPKITACSEQLTAQNISNALFGLQSFADRHPDSPNPVRTVLAFLAPQIETAEPLDTRQIGLSLYGLRGFCASPELAAVLRAFTPKIAAAEFTHHHIGMSMYGLQSCGDSEAMPLILAAFTQKLRAIGQSDPYSLSHALFGLQRCLGGPEAVAFVAALTPLVAQPGGEVWQAQDVAMAFKGLESLGDSAELRAMVAALAPKVSSCSQGLSDLSVLSILACLRQLAPGPELSSALNALAPHLVQGVEFNRPDIVDRCLQALEPITGQEADVVLRSIQQRAPDTPDWVAARLGLAGVQAPVADAALPPGWTMHMHEGKPYYHHEVHGSSWSRPEAAAKALPAGWAAHTAPDGRTYYHHAELGSRWEMPA